MSLEWILFMALDAFTSPHGLAPLMTCRYECKETDGSFMVAFPDCCLAVEWALTLQMALMAVPWPLELLQIDVTSEVFDPENSSQVDPHILSNSVMPPIRQAF